MASSEHVVLTTVGIGEEADGTALGAIARAGLVEALPVAPDAWPWPTFAVNLLGAALLAWAVTRLQERLPLSAYRRPFLGTGLCGALTTFSGFTLQVWDLADPGRASSRKAAAPAPPRQWSWRGPAYLGVSLGAGLLAALIPMAILR